jgi:hypothetical protein
MIGANYFTCWCGNKHPANEECDMCKGLSPCPCCKATMCLMDEPCLGCETYGEWLEERGKHEE